MSTSEIKAEFQQLEILADDELDAAISRGGMVAAFIAATVKRIQVPRGVGRPSAPKSKVLFHRRGRSDGRMSPNSTNIQLAELAKLYAECQPAGCTNMDAARAALLATTGKCASGDQRRLAKLMSNLPSRERGKELKLRARAAHGKNVPMQNLSSLSAQLNFYAKKYK